MLVVPRPSSVLLLDNLRSGYLLAGTTMHLFVNDYHPIVTTVDGDFTEASFPGYAPQAIPWDFSAFLNGANKAEIDADSPAVFTATGSASETVYGYWMNNPGDTALLWAERFATPVPISTVGDFVSVLARFTLLTEFTGP